MAYVGKLSRDQIVQQAIVLLDEQGLAAVSLRRIAERLGVSAPSLARHVGDKGELLTLVSAAIFHQALDLIPPGLHGDEWLAAFGHALRRKQADTRDIGELLTTTPPDRGHELSITSRLRDMMRDAGLEGEQAQLAQSAIQALVTGWMTFEKSARSALFAARLPPGDAFDASLRALINGFAQGRAG